MYRTDMEIKIRNFVLDTLMSQSGKSLSPELISELAQEIVHRTSDLFEYFFVISEDIPQ